jgi:penicillin-binding protein 1A
VTDFISKLRAMSTRLGNHPSNATSGSSKQPSSPSTAKARSPRRRRNPNSNQPPKPGKPLYLYGWIWLFLGLSASLGGGAITAYQTVQTINRSLPDSKDVFSYVRDGTLTLKAADGTVLQQLGPATRQKLTLSQIPPQLVEAFVASEDADFYQHNGIDYGAIARATVRNITARELVEGASTITQQVARMVFLDQERSFERKLREALLAQKLERELSKEQILGRYLNLVYLGSGAYGVADAAWIYFSKPVSALTLPEMAMIAGMPPAPSVYSPLVNPTVAQQRRDAVLGRMVKAGYITQAQVDQAIAAPLQFKPSQPRNLYSNVPYFTSYIQQQLPKYLSSEQLELGGLTVETTLNLKWQITAQETVKDAIERYGAGQGFEQAALVSLDPKTGEIRALVGGDNFNNSQFNRAIQAQRQPGSTFKGIVYTTAIAAGFSPYKGYVDEKFIVDGYEPQNYSRTYRGSVSMRDALIRSLNVVAVKVLVDVGFNPVVAMAKRMGIQSELVPAYSLALGASEVNLLELTSTYGTLAARGKQVEPHGITRILDRYGKVIYQADFKPQQAVDESSAAIMTWMLRGVVTNGTGGEAAIDRPVAGKTGTSERKRDLWFIGYIPQLVTGVWLGNDDSHPTWGASSTAARTWRNFMSEVVEGMAVEAFPQLPRLEGRRGSITAQPAKPRRVSRQGSGRTTEEQREVERSGNRQGTTERSSRTSDSSDSSAKSIPPETSRSETGRSETGRSETGRSESQQAPAQRSYPEPNKDPSAAIPPREAPVAPPASESPAPEPPAAPPSSAPKPIDFPPAAPAPEPDSGEPSLP